MTLPRPLEAVLISGGFGTRMLPLTEHRPKHLLTVGGVPFVEHQLTKLADVGVQHVVLATSYHADLFEPVLGDGSRFGLRLTYVTEDEPLGTGGAIRNVAGALTDDPDGAVVVLNGDVLSGHDLRAQLADFDTLRGDRRVDVSLHLVRVDDARAFGCVPTDDDGRVTAFVEKSDDPVTDQINAGCYVFRRDVIDRIPSGQVVSVERETFPDLVAADAVVVGYVEDAYWRDVGNPGALVAASRDLVTGRGLDALVHPSARVEGTVDGGSVIDRDAVVEAGATVTGSVVMAATVVRAGAVLTDAVVGERSVIEAGALVEGLAVGDGTTYPPPA